jgi:hypothetical protein
MPLKLQSLLPTEDHMFRGSFVATLLSFGLWLIFIHFTLSIVNTFYNPDISVTLKQAETLFCPPIFLSCLPEPVEQLCYSVAVLLTPPFLLGSLLAITHLYPRLRPSTQTTLFRLAILLFMMAVLFLLFFLYRAFTWGNSFFIRNNILHLNTYLYIFLFYPVLLFFVFYNSKKWVRWIMTGIHYLLIPLVFIAVFFSMLWTSDSIARWTDHINPLIFPLAQLLQGKTLLVNCPSLYGGLAFLLSPFFQLAPLSVYSFSIVMALLFMVVLFSIWYFLRKNTSNDALFVLGFLATLYFGYIDGRLFAQLITIRPDPFFQYTPIRMLFPYALLALFTRFSRLQSNDRRWYFLITFCMSCAPFWNLDSGFIAFCAWLGVSSYTELFRAPTWRQAVVPIMKHLFFSLLFLFFAFCAYSMYVYLKEGLFPNWTAFFQFYKIFPGCGFFMLPIATSIHPWMVVIGIYLLALLLSIHGLIKKENERLNTNLFLLSIMGTGLFTYFLGRSHGANLYPLLMMPVLIVILLIDHTIRQVMLNNKNYYVFIPLCLMGLFFCASAIPSLAMWSPTILRVWVKSGVISSFVPSSGPHSRNIAFIRQHTQPGESVFIYSDNSVDGIYHAETQTRSSLDLPSSTDYFLKTDMETLHSFFATNHAAKIFLLPGAFPADMAKLIDSRYTCTEQDPVTKISLLRPSK